MTPALGRLRLEDRWEFQASLGCTVSSRPDWARVSLASNKQRNKQTMKLVESPRFLRPLTSQEDAFGALAWPKV